MVRIVIGALLGLGGLMFRADTAMAILMGLAGVVILVEGTLGH